MPLTYKEINEKILQALTYIILSKYYASIIQSNAA